MADHRHKNPGRRKWNTRKPRRFILIVCEGEKTEPNYFKAFREKTRAMNIQIEVEGSGSNTFSVVRKAKELFDGQGGFDQVWCVFDKDDFPMKNVAKAFSLAKKAIQNAKKLPQRYEKSCKNEPCPSPSTTVVYLVEALNKEIAKYS